MRGLLHLQKYVDAGNEKGPYLFPVKTKKGIFRPGHSSAFSYHCFMLIYQQMIEQGNLTLGINSHKLSTQKKPLS